MDKGQPVPWSTGSAKAHLDEAHPSGILPLAVWCQFGQLPPELAMLDTGSEYSVIGSEQIELLGHALGEPLEPRTLSSRRGRFKGALHRLTVHLIAHQGKGLTIDTTVGAYPGWTGPSVLGFRGFLEHFRLALEPGDRDTPTRIHFGGYQGSTSFDGRRR
jgi:hypothetical protein